MKNILITGASTGIGYSIAKLLIEEGYFVFGSVRNENDALRLKKDFGANIHPLIFDVTDYLSIERAKKELVAKLDGKGLTALINNAGIAMDGPLKYQKIDDFEQHFKVNVFGLFKVTQTFLPSLGGESGSIYEPGVIINISSISGLMTLPFVGAYSASKYAVESITDVLRRELAIYGIDVISINPGAVKTPIWGKEKDRKNIYSGTDYSKYEKNSKKKMQPNGKNGIEPVIIAKKIQKILENNKRRPNYILMKYKLLFLFFLFMPKLLQDKIINKVMMVAEN